MGLFDRAVAALGGSNKPKGASVSNFSDKDLQELEQNEEKKKLAQWIRTKVEEVRASSNRVSNEGIWMTNIAYLLGYSGLQYNTLTRQFQQTNDTSLYLRHRKINVNKILPTIQNRLARLCKNPPKYDTIPENNTAEAKDKARLQLDVLQALLLELNADEKRMSLYMWLQECGHSFLGVYWDPSKGNLITDPETGEQIFEGDIRLDVCSAFEMFPDPLAKSDEDLQWIIRAKVRHLDYFRSNYENGDQVKEEETWLLSAQYEQRINSINTRGVAQGTSSISNKNTAIEMAYYEKPSRKYPRGRMCIAANGVLLEDKELPTGKIPFVKFDDVLIGGKFNSEAIITHLRPLQDAYNMNKRMRTEWLRKMLTGKYIAARGTQIAQESFNDQSGEFAYYTPVPNAPDGGRPMPLSIPTIPQYAYQEEQTTDDKFNEISGISEVSKGALPSASIPAIGMQLLVEQDDTRIGVVTEKNEHGWARVAELILLYAQKNYITPRKLKMAGKFGYVIKEITGKDIEGPVYVKVIRGSTLPGSKVLKRQEIINSWQQGLLGNPQDPEVIEKVLEMIEFGDASTMWLDNSLDHAQIKRGIETIKLGELPAVNELDNHVLWIRELNRYRKAEQTSLDETTLKLIEIVIQQHLNYVLKMSGQLEEEPTPEMQQVASAKADEELAKATASEQLGEQLQTREAALPENQQAIAPI